MRHDKESIEAAAQAGYDLATDIFGGPPWTDAGKGVQDYWRNRTCRIVDTYLERMVQAWAVQIGDEPIYGGDVSASKLDAIYQAEKFGKTRIVPVAIVELKSEKAA
jgi:hypothetical protein